MVFSVLNDLDENTKNEILLKIVNKESLEHFSEYSDIIKNYQRAFFQLTANKYYDFFKHRKEINKYVEFKLLDRISHSKPYYTFKDNKYILTSSRKCPICGKTVPEEELESHIKSDLEQQNKVIVLLDSSLKREQTRFEYESCTVKEIKKDIYNKIGVSISKLEMYKGDVLLGNNEILRNETVVIKHKRRTNK